MGQTLELDTSEAKGLFHLLDVKCNGRVNADEFVSGCLRLKGQAKSLDVATLLYENKKMSSQWHEFMRFVESSLMDVKKLGAEQAREILNLKMICGILVNRKEILDI